MFQHTWHFLLIALAGFINRRQQDVIEYLLEENSVLLEKFGRKSILLNHRHDIMRRLHQLHINLKYCRYCMPQ